MSDLTSRNLRKLENPDDVLESIRLEIQKSELALSTWKNKLIRYYQLYKMVQKRKHYEGLANIFVPEILRAVETVASILYRDIVGHTPWFEYKGREKFDEPSSEALTQLVAYQMDENSFNAKLMDSLRQLALTGLTVRKIMWDFRQVRVTKRTSKLQGEGVAQRRSIENERVTETVRDTWTFEPVDLLNFHISDITTPYDDIQKARWIGEQFLVDKQWIRERIRKEWLASDQFGLLDEANETTKGRKFSSQAANLVDQRNQISGFHLDAHTEDKFEIIERWGLAKASWVHTQEEMEELELNSDDMVETVIIIADRKAILKLEANPFWHGRKPYVSSPYVAQEAELPGIGVAQIGQSLQEELNDTRNQLMDNKTLVLANMWLKSRGSGIKNKDLRIRPMGVIQTNDMKGLQPLRPPILSGVGINIEGIIKNDLRESVGAPSNLQGIAQAGGGGTATESVILNREGLARLHNVAEMYGLLVIKPTLIMAEFLNYQFYDRVKTIKIIGEKGIKFRELQPDEIVGNKDVVVTLTSDTEDSPSVRRQQMIQFFTVIQQMPPELIQFHWGLLNQMYKTFFPHGDLGDLYDAPIKEVDLLSVEEELDLILGGTPVTAKPGQDHEAHIQQLTQDLNATKFALTPEQLTMLQALINSHQALLEEEVETAIRAKEDELQQTRGGGQSKPTGGLNLGQTPDVSAFTSRGATTPGQVMRNSRLGA